jgi:hypothetical protein
VITVFSRSTAKHWLLLSFVSLVLFLNTFSIVRENVYSRHSFVVLFFGLLWMLFIFILRAKWTIARLDRAPLIAYVGLLVLMLFATLINSGALAQADIVGALNNIAFQLAFIAFVLTLIAMHRPDRADLAAFYARLTVAFAFIASLAAYQLFFTGRTLAGPFHLEGTMWPQLYGWFAGPNAFVNVVALGLLSSIFLVFQKGLSAGRFFWVLFFCLALVLSGSKGGAFAFVLAVVLSVALLMLSRPSHTFSLLIKVGGASALLAAASVLLMLGYFEYSDRDMRWLLGSVVRVQSIATGTGRLDIWGRSIEILSTADAFTLLFGHGNNYIISTYRVSTHSAHLKIIVEYGLICYGVLWALFIYLIAKTYLIMKRDPALGFLVASSLAFVWIRTFFNTGLLMAGVIGFAFIYLLLLVSNPGSTKWECRAYRLPVK